MDWKVIRKKLALSREKYKYYDGSYSYDDPIDSKLSKRIRKSKVGWGKRAIDVRANKTAFDRFENDTLGLNAIMSKYRINEAFEELKNDVLVCGVGFLALAGDKVMPFTAEEATGTYDWYQQNLKDGVAVFKENTKEVGSDRRTPDTYISYTKNITVVHQDDEDFAYVNVTGRPFIGMLTYNSRTKQPFGRTVLSLPARLAIDDASRTTRQAMIAAHHYNTKVDVILGADKTTDVDKIDAKTGDVLKVGTNENGQIPQIGEFAQHAMAPFNDTILIAARNFCADTKLSLANLGIDTNAPQSTEALEIVSDDLKDDILAWHKEMGEQLKYFAVTLWMKDNNVTKIDDNIKSKIDATEPVWMPVFTADISKFGDGITKIAQQLPAVVKAKSIWRNLGLTSEEIDAAIGSEV